MSKLIKVTIKSTGLPLFINADRIESIIPLEGYTSIRTAGAPVGASDHVKESPEQIEAQFLRDKFAMAALTGILANSSIDDIGAEGIVHDAYLFADVMLKGR